MISKDELREYSDKYSLKDTAKLLHISIPTLCKWQNLNNIRRTSNFHIISDKISKYHIDTNHLDHLTPLGRYFLGIFYGRAHHYFYRSSARFFLNINTSILKRFKKEFKSNHPIKNNTIIIENHNFTRTLCELGMNPAKNYKTMIPIMSEYVNFIYGLKDSCGTICPNGKDLILKLPNSPLCTNLFKLFKMNMVNCQRVEDRYLILYNYIRTNLDTNLNDHQTTLVTSP